jgi:uncharacterized membrane protein
MAKKIETKSNKSDDSKLFAFLGVFLTWLGFIIVLAARKEDKYAMYYGKQGLILGIAWIAVWIVSMVLAFIPILGWIITTLLWIAIFALWVMGLIYAFSGEEKEILIVGQFAKMIKI